MIKAKIFLMMLACVNVHSYGSQTQQERTNQSAVGGLYGSPYSVLQNNASSYIFPENGYVDLKNPCVVEQATQYNTQSQFVSPIYPHNPEYAPQETQPPFNPYATAPSLPYISVPISKNGIKILREASKDVNFQNGVTLLESMVRGKNLNDPQELQALQVALITHIGVSYNKILLPADAKGITELRGSTAHVGRRGGLDWWQEQIKNKDISDTRVQKNLVSDLFAKVGYVCDKKHISDVVNSSGKNLFDTCYSVVAFPFVLALNADKFCWHVLSLTLGCILFCTFSKKLIRIVDSI